VVVIAQPASPAQVCVALGGTGIVGGSDVSGITINCDASSWTVGGTVTGLAGSGLVLQLNGANDLPVSASGSFSFGATIAQGHPYQVTILAQPTNPAQTCTITNGSGTIPRPTGFDVIVSCSTTGATVGGFVYVANDSTNDISVFTYDPATGALTVVPGARAGTGTRPVALAVHPTGRFLYAASGTSRDLRAYNIDPATGALTAVAGGIFTLNGTYAPQSIVIDPAGRHAYVTANTPVDLDDNISSEIMIFAIDPATGVLSQLGGSLFNRHLPSNDAAITPDGKSLYYAKGYGPQGLVALAVDGTTGALTPIAGYPLAGASVHALTVDPGGHFLYATNSTDETEEVRAYAIDTTGAVTFSSSSSAGVFPRELRFSPDGRIALVVDWMSAGRLSAYGINAATGALNPLSSIPAGGSPGALGVAPSGKYVYLTNLYRNTVSGFTLDPATGALSSVPGVFFATGHRPAAIAVVSK
jgi:6-phosphogluconolactonase (cycloisomerase 2 family)